MLLLWCIRAPIMELPIMEQIAMYLTALPCPPMPIIATVESKKEGNEIKTGVVSSHDILAGLLAVAMQLDDKDANLERMKKQLKLTDDLVTELEAPTTTVESAYNSCQRFTAEYITAFEALIKKGNPMFGNSIQFAPMDRVDQGDKVHSSTCSWHAAQDIQHVSDPSNRRDAAFFSRMTYYELMQVHVSRIRA